MVGKSVVSIITSGILFMSVCLAQGSTTQVEITNIMSDEAITGKVLNLPLTQLGHPCAAVYIHTDQWYIHPYAAAGPARSYSLVDAQGNWSIPTVKRDFPANQVAVVVMANADLCDRLPTRVYDLSEIGDRDRPIATKTYDLRRDKAEWYRRL